MKHEEVKSSNIRSIGYDDKAHIMEVRFNSGDLYQYKNVPVVLHMQLMAARSKGQYFAKYVRNNPAFPCMNITEIPRSEDIICKVCGKQYEEGKCHAEPKRNVGVIPDEKLKEIKDGQV